MSPSQLNRVIRRFERQVDLEKKRQDLENKRQEERSQHARQRYRDYKKVMDMLDEGRGWKSGRGLAVLLAVSHVTIHNWRRNNKLFGVPWMGMMAFPLWQLSPTHMVFPDVRPCIEWLYAHGATPFEALEFFLKSNPELSGYSPAQAFKIGEVDRVVSAVQHWRPSVASTIGNKVSKSEFKKLQRWL